MSDNKPKHAVGVSVILEDPRGQILLGERIGGEANGWFSTPGGRIERGEDMFECAAREVREETDLTVFASSLCVLGFREHRRFDDHYFMVYLLARKFEGTLKNKEPHKHKSWEWYSTTSLPSPCTEPKDIIEKLYVDRMPDKQKLTVYDQLREIHKPIKALLCEGKLGWHQPEINAIEAVDSVLYLAEGVFARMGN